MNTNPTKTDKLDELMLHIVNFECDHPALWAMPEFRELYNTLFDAVASAMEEVELSRVDRLFAEKGFVLQYDELVNDVSPN